MSVELYGERNPLGTELDIELEQLQNQQRQHNKLKQRQRKHSRNDCEAPVHLIVPSASSLIYHDKRPTESNDAERRDERKRE